MQRLLGKEPEIINECLEEFLISLDKVGNVLVESIRNTDWISVEQLTHRLKSSSLSTGALQVWQQCRNIEAARTADGELLAEHYADELLLTIEQAEVASRRFMADDMSGVQTRKAS